jgi:hypothetical protein
LPNCVGVGDYSQAMGHLSPDQRTELWEAIKDRLPELIKSGGDFGQAMRYLSPEQCTVLLEVMKARLPELINYSGYGFGQAMRYLSPEQCSVFLEVMKKHLPEFIKSVGDYSQAMKHLQPEQLRLFLNAMKSLLPTITLEQRTLFFGIIKNRLHEVIDSGIDFGHTLWRLTLEQRTVIFENIQEKLPEIIKFSVDFGYALHYLTLAQRVTVFERMEAFLPDMIQSGEDIYYTLINLTPEQRTVVLDSIKNLHSIFISAKDFGLAISYLNPDEHVHPSFIKQAHEVVLNNDIQWLQDMFSTCKNTNSLVIESMFTKAYDEKNQEMCEIQGAEIVKNIIKEIKLEKMLIELKVPKTSIDTVLKENLEKTMEDIASKKLSNTADIRSALLSHLKDVAYDKDNEFGGILQHRKHPKLDKLLSHMVHIEPKKFSSFKQKFNEIVQNERGSTIAAEDESKGRTPK